MLWAGVIRVSHLGGRDVGSDRFHSVRDQTADIERAVRARGDTVHLLPPELDVSGGLPLERRPALFEAVVGVEEGRYGGLAVAYLSRMGRDLRVMLEAWERIERAGGRVLVVREGIDTSTAAGRLQRDLLAAIDANLREQAGEMFERRRQVSAEAGVWKSPVPVGYLKDPQTRRLIPDPAMGPVVHRAFLDRAAGVSISMLSRHVGLGRSATRRMFERRVYLGELHLGPYVNLTAHEPLVTPAEWQAAQTVPRPQRGRTLPPALLAGLVVCGNCGHLMSRTGGQRQLSYRCWGNRRTEPCSAPATVACHRLDEHVSRVGRWQLEQLVARTATDTGTLRDARAALDRATLELAGYLEAVSAVELGADMFAAGARRRRQAVDTAQAQVDRLTAAASVGFAVSGPEVWDTATITERNHLLRHLLDMIVVWPANSRGRWQPLDQRVRVVRHGSGIARPARSGHGAAGNVPVLIDGDDECVLRVPGVQDSG